MQDYVYVDSRTTLQPLLEQYRQSELLVLDTEFVRTRTYYARLGLIQAYDGKTLALIDPVAIDDLSGFWQLLTAPNITKVLHSCSEDLEVFAHDGGIQPAPLLDSQIAAGLAGNGHGLGYAKLVQQYLGVALDKGESRTDWIRRPLTMSQLSYAANDVLYLYQLFPELKQTLEQQGRYQWALEESARMTKGRLTPPVREQAYLKVKNAFQLSSTELAVLRQLAAWRLDKAMKKDLALGFVMKDHALIALAKKQPRTINDIMRLKDLTDQEKRFYAKDMVNLINKVDFSSLPDPVDVLALKPAYKNAFKTLKGRLEQIATDTAVPMELLGSKRHINEYLGWYWNDKSGDTPLLLQGWRGQLVADALAKLPV
ncbi:ribonuclease D [Shewanella sp. YIC-542]|uniref:ribonuclease D n=1 Tax=Shewanella mytili TaxID=3377111 RepID=UPI00398E35A9